MAHDKTKRMDVQTYVTLSIKGHEIGEKAYLLHRCNAPKHINQDRWDELLSDLKSMADAFGYNLVEKTL